MLEQEQTINRSRVSSIDILRGFVMAVMLLDHVRERFFYHVPISDPIDIDQTSASLFFTRMLAHLCAPVFVFLTGLSAWLYAHPKNKAPRPVSSFLLKRGLFLIMLEVTVINLSWFGYYQTLYLQVIWAIGISMICLSVLCKLSLSHLWIGMIGFFIIFGHNTLTPISLESDELGYTLWTILHDRGYLLTDGFLKIKASYPVLPWIGVILIGYFVGPLYDTKVPVLTRKKVMIGIGTSALSLLLILRGFNLYGETEPWMAQGTLIQSVMSFFNYTKYPPSLDYLLLTIGVGCLLLSWFERVTYKWTEVLRTFGTAPMFFYILHLYILLFLYKVLVAIYGTQQGSYFGFDTLWQVWLFTIVLLVVLYYPTRWFSNYKRHSSSKLIKYF
ncbi:heparan-alpha-glucosaminide N-acetyltransferase domain-containing protein [Limibacter armeniacum]|uniref:DUF1624 domain-containing protein n=1 Tax=Limibacter armeniacum TaxID=466084 RepID=UPI002FE669B2